jgi:hypothetical protein
MEQRYQPSTRRVDPQSLEVTITAKNAVIIKSDADYVKLATPAQALDWLLHHSQIYFARLVCDEYPDGVTYTPDGNLVNLPPSVEVDQLDAINWRIKAFGVTVRTGEIVGVIRYLLNMMPKAHETPPRQPTL